MTHVSFLIPALNEEANIGRCIDSIRAFAGDTQYEIVVGDHGSTDRTVSIAEDRGARVVRYCGGTIAALRNFLVDNSTGSLIVFIDADVCLTPEWGAEIGAAMADVQARPKQLTGSRCRPPPSENLIIKHWFAEMPTDKHRYLGTGHIIFARSAFVEIGGFDPRLRTGEDFEFCMRAQTKGYAININPRLKVIHHDYPLTVRQFLRRERWHGTGDFQSITNIVRSKLALVTLVFVGLHLALMVLLFVDLSWAAACAAAIALMTLGMSIVK